ncbi:MAG TPA: thymidine phosphorylase [Thermoanaerobaculia bacterium]|jgi:pyrimidine-nucleoside phosphorylase|nr:thymidine phosphorylase [Thermoanaerobaculia bacterium]
MTLPYALLERKRAGEELSAAEIGEVVQGAVDGSWSEGQLGAFLMAAAIRGLSEPETSALTRAMLDSGERWRLAEDMPTVCDKHSTGGVGDKVSLTLGPLLAACGQPIAMLVGRGLGHTGGTADKLESIPGFSLDLDRRRCLGLLSRCGLAMGIATAAVAPADRRLYALRDATATIDSIPLIVASILSKKLAAGPAAVVFDVKVGEGAFLPELERARELARRLAGTLAHLGIPATAFLTDMNQPLGVWSGNAAEVREAIDCLEGGGPADLREETLVFAEEVCLLMGRPVERGALERALDDGSARERFFLWAELQGADPKWLANPRLDLAPAEHPLLAARSGWLARVRTRELGLLLVEAGGGRARPGDRIDHGVALGVRARLGDRVEVGDELGRIHSRLPEPALAERFAACFEIGSEPVAAPKLVVEKIGFSG